MRHLLVTAAFCLASTAAQAVDISAAVDEHILPGYAGLAEKSRQLHAAAEAECRPESPALLAAYGEAFDAWVRISHLRFGPSEQNNRAFALAFWPDPRGATPKALARLMAVGQGSLGTLDTFQTVSIAARGFYAMEFLLFDAQFRAAEDAETRCALVQLLAADIADTSADILAAWQDSYADLMRNAGSNDIYRSEAEAAQQLFTAASTGLEFTSQVRLGRPMGSFERPRPNRAEARRSGRSLRHVVLSLEGTRDLVGHLSDDDAQIDAAFAAAIARAGVLDDPVFAGVADIQGRLRVEVLQQSVETIRQVIAQDLAPRLGIAAGFNALDGD
ncbi:imelysin family protein [Roseobacter weihaiensis]|uniref:imelysin family protein n=1 Tax=Roseobacter weihaiensis TaxID=2763262 RepID=UPI001D0A728D|nr:imelysin family protein [Roseobacter sp. H9]